MTADRATLATLLFFLFWGIVWAAFSEEADIKSPLSSAIAVLFAMLVSLGVVWSIHFIWTILLG